MTGIRSPSRRPIVGWLFMARTLPESETETFVIERGDDGRRTRLGRIALRIRAQDAAEHRERHRPQAEMTSISRVAHRLARERDRLVASVLFPARIREPI